MMYPTLFLGVTAMAATLRTMLVTCNRITEYDI